MSLDLPTDIDLPAALPPARFPDGTLPPQALLGDGTIITGGRTFSRFFATQPASLRIGRLCALHGCSLALGTDARVEIGDLCEFHGAVLLSEASITIGSRVVLCWSVNVADTDFHPLDPSERLLDSVACSPAPAGTARRSYPRNPVVIEDDVYVGPCATILKGVRIGRGSYIEPGSLVTRDVPPGSRVCGNPARVIGPHPEAR